MQNLHWNCYPCHLEESQFLNAAPVPGILSLSGKDYLGLLVNVLHYLQYKARFVFPILLLTWEASSYFWVLKNMKMFMRSQTSELNNIFSCQKKLMLLISFIGKIGGHVIFRLTQYLFRHMSQALNWGWNVQWLMWKRLNMAYR